MKTKQSTHNTDSQDSVDYMALGAELSKLMENLEDGELDIDEAVKSYERGLEIVGTLETQLQKAENRVTELRAEHTSAEEE